ncbi:MAG: carboxylesterase/lipase family protein [Lachnospiraceae bacterium]|nr:carboxylesterase/lipase family protein [Lachnospiraceae bacterium]
MERTKESTDTTVVRTRDGMLRGSVRDGVYQFLGVPYAAPPVGALRFRKPQPVQPWEGIREAVRYADYCPQPGKAYTMVSYTSPSEDCLYLNIYTPGCDDRKRPVLIWIHGGAYMTGSGSSCIKQGNRMSAQYDMVVVSVQYRLGAFGCVDFASLKGANGLFDHNPGTWDQVAAVEWVIENIGEFGGDPDCITLMGESAGGSSVLTLITTPYLKGKIRRAVMDSPAPHLINSLENGRAAALDVLEKLGLSEQEAYKAASLPADDLVSAVEKSEYGFVHHHPYLLPTAPVTDGDLIPELPYDALMHGAADGIDLLIGTTQDEGTLFSQGKEGDIFPGNAQQMEKFFGDHPGIDAAAVRALYANVSEKRMYQEIGKEIFFHLPSMEIAERMALTGSVYMHHFDYAFPVLRTLGLGAVHCTNSALTCGMELTGAYHTFGLFSGKNGRTVSERMFHYISRFIVSGDPNGGQEPLWPEYGTGKNTLFINVSCHAQEDPFRELRNVYGIIRPYGN